MKKTSRVNIHNKFEIKVLRDGKVIQEGFAENIVLNRMYTNLVNFQAPFTHIVYGRGTGTPLASRTTLFSRIGGLTASHVEHDLVGSVLSVTKKSTIPLDTSNGEVITEVGISDQATSINTHAMITDSEGNTISITKTNLDIIEIYATLYIEFVEDGSYGFILFPKVTGGGDFSTYDYIFSYFYSIFIRNIAINFTNSMLFMYYSCNKEKASPIYSSYGGLNGIELFDTTERSVTYDVPNKKTTLGFRIPVDKANTYNGITNVALTGLISFPLTDIVTPYEYVDKYLATGNGTIANFDLPHVDARNLVVKVDGVATTAFTYVQENRGVNLQEYFDVGMDYRTGLNQSVGARGIFSRTGESTLTYTPFAYDSTIKDISSLTAEFFFNIPTGKYGKVYLQGSNDLETWNDINSLNLTYGTPTLVNTLSLSGVNSYDYLRFKIVMGEGTNFYRMNLYDSSKTDKNRIEFTTAPADGAVITVDYDVPYLIKDTNHVIDVEIEIQWGEGTVV